MFIACHFSIIFSKFRIRISLSLKQTDHIQTLCKSAFAQTIYRKIEGALVWSQDERNLNCLTTFQTHSILQHFLLRFDMLQLDCNDHLYVYDGGSAVGSPKYNVSCRDTKQLFGVLVTQTNFVTLKYVTDNWGTDINGFKLVITAIKDPSKCIAAQTSIFNLIRAIIGICLICVSFTVEHVCQSFLCASRELCIHSSLRCDGVNHCGDDSDEESCRGKKFTSFNWQISSGLIEPHDVKWAMNAQSKCNWANHGNAFGFHRQQHDQGAGLRVDVVRANIGELFLSDRCRLSRTSDLLMPSKYQRIEWSASK